MVAVAAATCAALVSASGAADAQRSTSDARGSRRLPVTLTVNTPPAGALTPISGHVDGLPAAADTYKVCIYLESTASGQSLFNGPKPFEDAGSDSPVDAAGDFNYVKWWANDVYDVVVPFIYVFVVPRALGNCAPVMGGPAMPARIYTDAVAWVRVPRTTTFQMTAIAPPPATVGPITGTVVGLTDAAAQYKVIVYRKTADGMMTGPLPTCADSFDLAPVAGDATRATFAIAGWAGPDADGANAAASHLVTVLVPRPLPLSAAAAVCVANVQTGAAAMPPAIAGPTIVMADSVRAAATPVPTIAPTPTATPLPGTATPLPDSSAAPATPSPTLSPSPLDVGAAASGAAAGAAIAVTAVTGVVAAAIAHAARGL